MRKLRPLLSASILLATATSITLQAQTFTTLHSFDGADGRVAAAALVQATDGALYGTTENGGVNDQGTVFKITASGTLTTVHSFDGRDGIAPGAALVQDTDGNFYGTTIYSGIESSDQGTVFKITPGGTLTTLYSFCSQFLCLDGSGPYAALVRAINGNFYGATFFGANGYGTIFEITPSGALTTVYNFCSQSNCTDGANPYAALVQAIDGNLYGTTETGGANGDGTVFKITPSGVLTTLHSFNGADGHYPGAGLVQAADGNFYGATTQGGASAACTGGCGTFYRMTPTGTTTMLHSFDSTHGGGPLGLIQATDGNFYGTTFQGGSSAACTNGCGTVFKITPRGALTTLHSFDSVDGVDPQAALVQDTNGKFYGTTFQGGASGDGTIFSLSVGLHPFIETQTTSGIVGGAVKILGTNLTGATNVAFNGSPATFTVASNSLITATIPAGATSGFVTVTTTSGTLTSNRQFHVIP